MPVTAEGKVDPAIRANPPLAPVKPDTNITTEEEAQAIVAGIPLVPPPTDPTPEETKPPVEVTITDLFPDARPQESEPMDDRPAIARQMAQWQPDRSLRQRTTMETPDMSPFRGGDRMRHVVIDKDSFEKWVGRTDDGYKLIVAWGSPVNGIYTPTISVDRSDKLG